MARLPASNITGQAHWLIQADDDGTVTVSHELTDDLVVSYNAREPDSTARAQKMIHDSDMLTDEQKSFAHFWSGYFYAHFFERE